MEENVKLKIWLHYVASVSFFNHDLIEVDLNSFSEKHFGKDYKKLIKYPNLIPDSLFVKNKTHIKPRCFKDFCNEEDDRVTYGLKGYYWRFKNQIFKQ